MTKFTFPILSLVAAISFAFAIPAKAQQPVPKTVAEAFAEGVRLYNADQFQEAIKYFEAVRVKNPRDPRNQRYLNLTKLAIKQGRGPKKNLADDLKAIVIPEIDFKDASIGDVMTYLSQRVEEVTGGKTSANFIYQGSNEQRDNTTVTLKMKNVPLTEVIRYVGSLTNTTFRYEEHAIVATPASGAAVPTTTPAPAEPTSTVTPLPATPAPSPFD